MEGLEAKIYDKLHNAMGAPDSLGPLHQTNQLLISCQQLNTIDLRRA
jgi:hypothetical protein